MYATEQSYNPEDDQDAIDAVNATDPAGAPMRLLEYRGILEEIESQPHWRAQADKEMEYVDGNQLSSELLSRQKAVGIPPAIAVAYFWTSSEKGTWVTTILSGWPAL